MLAVIRDIIWGPATVSLIAVVGIVLSFKTGFRALKSPIKNFKETIFSKNNSSSFKAMCTALGGTIGVGNTVGVASALVEGGAGALFWLVVASLFGMVIKEAEIYLAVKFKEPLKDYSGPMYYIEKGIGSKSFAVLWCVSCIMTSLGMGNLSQSMAATGAISYVFSISEVLCALFMVVSVFAILIGGRKRIKESVSFFIPIVSIMFIVFSVFIITINRERLPRALGQIFSSVFNLKSGSVGVKWALFSAALREGFSRGVFSNEAGLGSASVVHSSSNENNAQKQAKWGVVEVFVDTVLICTITGLVILTAETPENCPVNFITLHSFVSALGKFGGVFYALSMFLFALASILAWYYYAECALDYLGAKSKARSFFRFTFVTFTFIGGIMPVNNSLVISDIFNGIMLVLNLSALLLLSGKTKIN